MLRLLGSVQPWVGKIGSEEITWNISEPSDNNVHGKDSLISKRLQKKEAPGENSQVTQCNPEWHLFVQLLNSLDIDDCVGFRHLSSPFCSELSNCLVDTCPIDSPLNVLLLTTPLCCPSLVAFRLETSRYVHSFSQICSPCSYSNSQKHRNVTSYGKTENVGNPKLYNHCTRNNYHLGMVSMPPQKIVMLAMV